jgi:hypothetical protein
MRRKAAKRVMKMFNADQLYTKVNRMYVQSSDSSSDYEVSSNPEETKASCSHFNENVTVVAENNCDDDTISIQDYEQIDEEVYIETLVKIFLRTFYIIFQIFSEYLYNFITFSYFVYELERFSKILRKLLSLLLSFLRIFHIY